MTPKPDSTVAMTQHLVSINTVSRDSNLPLIDFAESWLHDHGARTFRIASDDGAKCNLVASIGPDQPGGVVLSGHTDVVPVDGQDWRADPFKPWIEDGRLFGRGTCDMKGFIAAGLKALPDMKSLKRPIHFALSYDEEIGCLGAPRMIQQIVDKLPPVEAVVVGEPTSMGSVSAHKGIVALKTRVTGYETHSSQTHRGVSAVMVAARLVNWLDAIARELEAEVDQDCGFMPPYTTVHVGVIKGGTAINIVSRNCEFIWDIRAVPSEDVDALLGRFQAFVDKEILPEMRRRHPGAGIETEVLANAPGFEVCSDNPAVELVQRLTGIGSVRKVSYAAEAGQFQGAGFNTVICGPGSIDQAHQPNEFIELSQLDQVDHFIRQLVAEQSS